MSLIWGVYGISCSGRGGAGVWRKFGGGFMVSVLVGFIFKVRYFFIFIEFFFFGISCTGFGGRGECR